MVASLETEVRLLVEDVAVDDPTLARAIAEVIDPLLQELHRLAGTEGAAVSSHSAVLEGVAAG